MQLKPIETEYNGLRFRSRAEARIAVFLTALGVPFQYEKEGYDLGIIGPYLPDFDTPHGFVEVKGERPTPFELLKAATLAQVSGRDVFVISDDHCYKLDSVTFCELFTLEEIGEELHGNCLTIDAAIKAMRQARFEHGEKPQTQAIVAPLRTSAPVPSPAQESAVVESPLIAQRRFNNSVQS